MEENLHQFNLIPLESTPSTPKPRPSPPKYAPWASKPQPSLMPFFVPLIPKLKPFDLIVGIKPQKARYDVTKLDLTILLLFL